MGPYRFLSLEILDYLDFLEYLGGLDCRERYSFTLLVAVRPLMWTRTR